MSTNNYFFYISIPKDGHIEYVIKLNSFILKLFPEKTNPYIIRPMEINDEYTISKVTINTTEENIREFAVKFFGNYFKLIRHKNGDFEIAKKQGGEIIIHNNNIH